METLTFQARHSYGNSRDGVEVPIMLTIAGAQPVRFLAKVDTGASFCIFQREYADRLGIDVENGEYQRVNTAVGSFDVYGHTVTLSCLEWDFQAKVYFAAMAEFPRNVLGRSGWLQQFRLGLVDHDGTLFLSHYDD